MKLFEGIINDIKLRLPYYINDWFDKKYLSSKILSSSLYMFFTSIAPAITFSIFLLNETDGNLGAIEVLLSSSITGMLFSIFAGQPLVIVGVTGPVTILTVSIYNIAKSFNYDFFVLFGLSQILAGIIFIILAILNICNYIHYLTRFSCEIFGVLIGLIYLYTGIEGIVNIIYNNDGEVVGIASKLTQILLALLTIYLCNFFNGSKRWMLFSSHIRRIIVDYSTTISILLITILGNLIELKLDSDNDIPKLYIPDRFTTSNGRDWVVSYNDLSAGLFFFSLLLSLIIVILFFFDHNVSSIMAQNKDFNLKKGSAFHLDFFVVGISLILTGIFAIPPTNGLIPQAPLHVISLISKKKKKKHIDHYEDNLIINTENKEAEFELVDTGAEVSLEYGKLVIEDVDDNADDVIEVQDEESSKKEDEISTLVHNNNSLIHDDEEIEVLEQRWTNFFQSFLSGLCCFMPFSYVLCLVPKSILYGLFVFLGFESFKNNLFALRILLLIVDKKSYKKLIEKHSMFEYDKIKNKKNFVLLQFILCIIIFVVTKFTPLEVIFPVLIGFLVIVRSHFLTRYFTTDELNILDASFL